MTPDQLVASRADSSRAWLSHETRRTLAAAFGRCLVGDSLGAGTEIALRRCARDARRAHVKPEHMVIALAAIWDEREAMLSPEVAARSARFLALEVALDSYFETAPRVPVRDGRGPAPVGPERAKDR